MGQLICQLMCWKDGKQECTDNAQKLSVLSWNIAAVNNNPFEYWISHDDISYNKMMEDVQNFIDNPGVSDIPVADVFTPKMFSELKKCMHSEGWSGVNETELQYKNNFQKRLIISQFIKDKDIGKKRLASMPDRVTNTINTVDQGVICRPTVINCYEGRMDTTEEWWVQWKEFFFNTTVSIQGRQGVETKKICSMLSPIRASKYPAVTPEEEAISIPLQALCQAIFDAVLVHMLNKVAPGIWFDLKMQLCNALNKKKNERTFEILEQAYTSTDIMFLQEVAASFSEAAKTRDIGQRYEILTPEKMDSSRDQNSVIFVKKGLFKMDTLAEITSLVSQEFPSNCPVAEGDLFAITVTGEDENSYLLASFHGDTNGLATIPVVKALNAVAQSLGSPRLIFGLDANTYEKGGADTGLQDVTEFAQEFVSLEMTSCFGDTPNPKNYTTFNARTYLQPQLNKAVKNTEKETKGDINPKDFILFYKSQFESTGIVKDNCGQKGKYIEGMVFPTLEFPSDHGIISCELLSL